MNILTSLCYTLFMEYNHWLAWKKFLERNGLTTLVRELLANARSAVVIISQLMVLGLPIFKISSWGDAYSALVTTLGDREKLDEFSDFLMEAEG